MANIHLTREVKQQQNAARTGCFHLKTEGFGYSEAVKALVCMKILCPRLM